ncbi:MAG: TRAP transporter substrate-binding protein [Treponema sp.]|nr:TRAP transporter substrate-binding protein [Treponema sp.]
MKRFSVVLLSLLVLAAAITMLPGCQRQQGRTFRMADNHSVDYPTNVGNRAFIEYIYRETNGEIRIELFHSAQLGQETETVQLTQLGEIAFNRLGVTFLASVNPQIGAFGMPFLYRDREHMFRVLDGPIGDEALRMLEAQSLLGLSWYDAGSRNFYTTGRPIRTLDDMTGMRLRVQEVPLMMEMVRLLGASPTPMAMGEVYSGIQNNIVDGAENNWPSYTSWSHNEVARYFTLSEHVASPEMILVNTRIWEGFSAGEQAIIRRAAQYAAGVQRQAWLDYEREAEALARATGTEVIVLSPAERQRFVTAMDPLFTQPAYAGFAPLIARIRAVE